MGIGWVYQKALSLLPSWLKSLLIPKQKTWVDKDFRYEFEDIVKENGYVFDQYSTVTEDGYILETFRVRQPNLKRGAPVVFMMHGIMDSADCWVMNYGDKAPAFMMAKQGYDVWLGN